MKWNVLYLPEAEKELENLDKSQSTIVQKAIKKVQNNPLPANEQGYGKPLGNHKDTKLSGLLKIKIRSTGLRVVYKLIRVENTMCIVVIGARADGEVYEIAQKRIKKYGLFK